MQIIYSICFQDVITPVYDDLGFSPTLTARGFGAPQMYSLGFIATGSINDLVN